MLRYLLRCNGRWVPTSACASTVQHAAIMAVRWTRTSAASVESNLSDLCERADGLPSAMQFLYDRALSGHPPTSTDFGRLLRHAVIVLRQPQVATAMWKSAVDYHIPITREMIHYRVLGVLIAGDIQAALKEIVAAQQLSGVKAGQNTWVELMKRALRSHRNGDVVNEVLSHIEKEFSGLHGDTSGVTLMEWCMEAYVAALKPKMALTIYDEMLSRGLTPTLFGYNAALHAWSQITTSTTTTTHANALQSVTAIFRHMREHAIMPTAVSYNHYIAILCNVNQVREAMKMPAEMLASGIQPQLHTYCVLLSGLVRSHQYDLAWEVFAAMDTAFKRASEVYGTLLQPFSSVSEGVSSEHCVRVLQQLEAEGGQISDIVVNVLLRGLLLRQRLSAALALLEYMRVQLSVSPSPSTYRTFVFSAVQAGQFDAALQVLERGSVLFERDTLKAFAVRGIRECLHVLDSGETSLGITPQLTLTPAAQPPAPKLVPLSEFIRTALRITPSEAVHAPDHVSSLRRMVAMARLMGITRSFDSATQQFCKERHIDVRMPLQTAESVLSGYSNILKRIRKSSERGR